MKNIRLRGVVDRAARADENDTWQIKSALGALGYYKTPGYGVTPYPDEPMFDGIKKYQRDNKLRVDGVMKPGGETEDSMNNRVADVQAAERARHGAKVRRKQRHGQPGPTDAAGKTCPDGYYSTNEKFCVPFTGVCMDNWVCRPYPSDGGTRG